MNILNYKKMKREKRVKLRNRVSKDTCVGEVGSERAALSCAFEIASSSDTMPNTHCGFCLGLELGLGDRIRSRVRVRSEGWIEFPFHIFVCALIGCLHLTSLQCLSLISNPDPYPNPKLNI